MYHARGLVSTANRVDESSKELETLGDNVEANWYENWYDGLGYCECESCQYTQIASLTGVRRHVERSWPKVDCGKGNHGSRCSGR